jgi:hypothetical protein
LLAVRRLDSIELTVIFVMLVVGLQPLQREQQFGRGSDRAETA